MKIKLFITALSLIYSTRIVAQISAPVKEIDSIFQKLHVSDNDWAMALTIEQAGIIPIYDSLGNPLDEAPTGTFILFKTGENYLLQKIWYDYSFDKIEPVNVGKFEPKTAFGNRLKLLTEINISYTTDSLKLAENEWIQPFIYKNDSLGIYCVQSASLHEPYYSLYFKTARHDGYIKQFTETDMTEMYSFFKAKNLNYKHNSGTFISRVFTSFNRLIKLYLKSSPLP